jgi:hypothetical protein
MVLFGKPKCGKTVIASALENNLLIDLEDGSDFVEAMKIKVSSVKDLKEVKKAIIANHYPYDYITLDTATQLEEMILPLAKSKYKNTPMGKSFSEHDVRLLPNGVGYLYIREAYQEVVESFRRLAPHIILLGHTKDKLINKEGKELSENTLDLSGKLARLIPAKADALGYVYRKKSQTIINFNGGGDSIVEARPSHLRGKEIVVAESDDQGNMTFHWDRIYQTNKHEKAAKQEQAA